MHLFKNKVITLLIALVFSVPGFSQVPSGPFRINEYSCANVSGLTSALPGAGTPDWFEIYNNTTSPRSIAGWYVTRDLTQNGWQFPINTTIPANGYLVVFASGFDTVITTPTVEYHTDFNLLQTKAQERIILTDNNGVVKDSVTIRRNQQNHSWARVPNGTSSWRVFARVPSTGAPTWTPGALNPPTTGVGNAKSFRGYLPVPIISQSRGFYSGSQQISFSIPNSAASLPNLQIFYLGAPGPSGGEPHPGYDPSAFLNYEDVPVGTRISYLYDGTAVTIDSSTVLRFFLDTADITINPGPNSQYLPSFVETHSFFIDGANILRHGDDGSGGPVYVNTNFTLPVISVSFDSTTSGNYPGANGPVPHSYMVSLEYFDKNKNFKFGTVGVATLGSGDDAQIPFNYMGFNYSAEDEFGFSYTNKQQLYTNATLNASSRTEQTNISFKAAGSDNFPMTAINTYLSNNEMSVHFRDPLCQTYAMNHGIHLDGTHYAPCIMYINGQYYGIYDIREVFDREYTKYYYGTDSDSLQVLLKDGASFQANTPQAATDWGALVNYIISNDMRVEANRHYADSLLDFNSLIDLVIYNGYTVNTGFPQKALWWRGPDIASNHIKWHYAMFDMEDTYGLDENSASLPSTLYNASVCQAEGVYSDTVPPVDSSLAHLGIFTALMQSDTFKAQFINRYSYLLNNSLRCPPIIAQVNYLRNLLAPEMYQHATNMGPSNPMPHALDTMWGIHVDTMIYWINQRCPTITEDIKTCYNVTGPWSFCTDVEPINSGAVVLNEVSYPDAHSDIYFGNILFNAIGVPNENYIFDHWELESFTLPDSISLTNDSLHWLFDTTSCIKAVFKLKEPYQTVGEPAVPTGFSPNGDGINDLLNVYGTLNVSDYNFQVYNRWGQKIWESGDKTKGWDGTYKGQEAPVGVYAYVFKVSLDGKQIQKSGNITLIR